MTDQSQSEPQPPDTTNPATPPRRNFVQTSLAVLYAGVAGLLPVGAGLAFFLDPLLRKKPGQEEGFDSFTKVTDMAALDKDGLPQSFTVYADQIDAWNKTVDEPIGAVFLMHDKKQDKVLAFNVKCPHLSCTVEFKSPEDGFLCPCHHAKFAADGTRENGVSPRDLDALEVEIRNDSEIWVKFENFRPATSEKVPVV